MSPLFEALDLVATTEAPTELPTHGPWRSRWKQVAEDPEPLLSLAICTRTWLLSSIESLITAEKQVEFEGDHLVHADIYSANVAFTAGGAILVDWGASSRGSRWIDVAFAVLSVRVEGATSPSLELPGEASFAAALEGHFAVEAPALLPDWAEPGSTLRADMASDLAHALRWSAELLDLPPLS